jgi:hypothetical protein
MPAEPVSHSKATLIFFTKHKTRQYQRKQPDRRENGFVKRKLITIPADDWKNL